MRTLLFVLVPLWATGCAHGPIWKGELVRPTSRTVLYADRAQRGTVESWRNPTNGQVGRTVWQVVFRPDGSAQPTPFFTVEQIQGEKNPTAPVYAEPWDEPIISDFPGSDYQYSIAHRKFVKQTLPEQIYLGGYRSSFGRRPNPAVQLPPPAR